MVVFFGEGMEKKDCVRDRDKAIYVLNPYQSSFKGYV